MATVRKSFDGVLPPGQVVGYKLNGHYDFRGAASQPGQLRSSGILESHLLTDEQGVRLRNLLAAPASFGGEGMRCFNPGMGFSIGMGSEMVEVLVCLRCYWAYLFQGDQAMHEALSKTGHAKLAGFYVELFPGSGPKTA
jgi:hypothetical protein